MVYESNYSTRRQYNIPTKSKRLEDLAPGNAIASALAEYRQACRKPSPPYDRESFVSNQHDERLNSPMSDWNSGRRYLTRAGFRVRSKAEKIIADFLHVEGFQFIYEPMLQLGTDWVSPDFYLTDLQLPYEHFGMDTHDYQCRAEAKIARYVSAGVPFVYTTFNDETDLEDILTEKLVEFY